MINESHETQYDDYDKQYMARSEYRAMSAKYNCKMARTKSESNYYCPGAVLSVFRRFLALSRLVSSSCHSPSRSARLTKDT